MANPRLTNEQLEIANDLLADVRKKLKELAGENPELLFAYRRKVAKELGYHERGKPMHRGKIKRAKLVEQNGLCAECAKPMPPSDNILDRAAAIGGYTMENTRLICRPCDTAVQRARGFA
jgi:ribosomal protein L44E